MRPPLHLDIEEVSPASLAEKAGFVNGRNGWLFVIPRSL
jgi:hypothetical protein